MARFIALRVALALPVIFAVLVVSFFLTHVVPGDPISALVGEYPAPAEYVAKMRSDFGLDEPITAQFALYLAHLSRGDLGFSFANQQPVLALVLQRAGNTLLLMLPALVLASVGGTLVGLLAATRRSRAADTLLTSMSMLGYSIPAFWLGQLLIIGFAVKLGWFPAQGMSNVRAVAEGWAAWRDLAWHWALPGFAATLFYSAVVARVARTSVLEALHQDFVTTAMAKGLSRSRVLLRHVLPNAMMPIASVVGYNFGHAITGTILIESVFAWPGLGGLFVSAIGQRDYPVLQGIFLAATVTVIVANLITDLLYAFIDPRVRHDRHRK